MEANASALGARPAASSVRLGDASGARPRTHAARLFRDRLVLEARLAGEQEINGRRLAAVWNILRDFPV